MNKGLIALLAACTLLFGCASQRVTPEQQALNELKWDYAENAIVLNFSASKDLNQYAGQSHNLLVVITNLIKPMRLRLTSLARSSSVICC